MQPKIKSTGSPVHNALSAYTLVFYAGTFTSFIIYYFTRDRLWFEAAYAANIGGMVMAFFAGVTEMMNELSHQSDGHERKTAVSVRSVLNLIAFLLFALNLLLLKNQWSVSHPNAFASIWITGDGLLCMVCSEFRSIASVLKSNTEQTEVSNRDMTEMS